MVKVDKTLSSGNPDQTSGSLNPYHLLELDLLRKAGCLKSSYRMKRLFLTSAGTSLKFLGFELHWVLGFGLGLSLSLRNLGFRAQISPKSSLNNHFSSNFKY